ncbi:hypothetical protein J6590_006883 [Homalodisca vitripennis]|nr:hypothetical protein J6590_006883 [Homalodisca vitripennis]
MDLVKLSHLAIIPGLKSEPFKGKISEGTTRNHTVSCQGDKEPDGEGRRSVQAELVAGAGTQERAGKISHRDQLLEKRK